MLLVVILYRNGIDIFGKMNHLTDVHDEVVSDDDEFSEQVKSGRTVEHILKLGWEMKHGVTLWMSKQKSRQKVGAYAMGCTYPKIKLMNEQPLLLAGALMS